jgi:hypothetical protein
MNGVLFSERSVFFPRITHSLGKIQSYSMLKVDGHGFESSSGHGCLSLVLYVVLSCVGRGLCDGLNARHRSPTVCLIVCVITETAKGTLCSSWEPTEKWMNEGKVDVIPWYLCSNEPDGHLCCLMLYDWYECRGEYFTVTVRTLLM